MDQSQKKEKGLDREQKAVIDAAVKKIVKEYGKALKLLSRT